MKSLSIRNPWAHFISTGEKSIELRTWNVAYRGPLLIVSGARPAAEGMLAHGLQSKDPRFAYGQALCLVDLVDIRPSTAADAEHACATPCTAHFSVHPGAAARIRRFPLLGRLSIFDVPDAWIVLAQPDTKSAPRLRGFARGAR